MPVLVYPDVRAAVDWLSEAFGFTERVRIGDGASLPAGHRRRSGDRRRRRATTSVRHARGEVTHRVMVRVPDASCALRARAAGRRADPDGAHATSSTENASTRLPTRPATTGPSARRSPMLPRRTGAGARSPPGHGELHADLRRRAPSRPPGRAGLRAPRRLSVAALRGRLAELRGDLRAGRAARRRLRLVGPEAGRARGRDDGQLPGGLDRLSGAVAGRPGRHPGDVPAARARVAPRDRRFRGQRGGDHAGVPAQGDRGGRGPAERALRDLHRGLRVRRAAAALADARRRGADRPARRRRPGGSAVHRRHDRPGQGRDALARQPALLRARGPRGRLRPGAQPLADDAADVARLRTARHRRRDALA